MSRLDEIEARLADTSGWLEWISPRATTEIAVVYADGDVYLPTGGTAEEFAFANLQGRVHPLTRKDDLAALVAVVRAVRDLHRSRPNSTSALHPVPLCTCGMTYPCLTVQALDGLEAS